jgi:hypothetical protein
MPWRLTVGCLHPADTEEALMVSATSAGKNKAINDFAGVV